MFVKNNDLKMPNKNYYYNICSSCSVYKSNCYEFKNKTYFKKDKMKSYEK